jgi:translation initiation factor 2A
MPNTKITIFDLKCQKVVDLGDTGEARNTLYYDPKGRILCAGGFGAINGNMDFWDLSSDNIVKIDSTNAFSSSYHEWSPDGYHFLTGVVAPRMRQDNGIKIFNYHGELIYKEDIPELFAVHWRPQSPDLFQAGLIPPNPNATKIAPLNAPKPYRHPNFSGVAPTAAPPTTQPAKSPPTRFTPGGPARPKPGGTLVGGELDDTPAPEPVKVPPKKTGPSQSPITPQQTPQTGSSSPPVATHNPQPPLNPPHNPSSNPSPHNKPYPTSNPNPYNPQSRKERPYNPSQQHQPYKKGPPRNTESPKEKSGGNIPTTTHNNNNNNLSESEKRRRTLIKKMREIQNLKQKQAAGETLLPAQLAKIASESQIQADLDSLPKSETSEVKTPRQ